MREGVGQVSGPHEGYARDLEKLAAVLRTGGLIEDEDRLGWSWQVHYSDYKRDERGCYQEATWELRFTVRESHEDCTGWPDGWKP